MKMGAGMILYEPLYDEVSEVLFQEKKRFQYTRKVKVAKENENLQACCWPCVPILKGENAIQSFFQVFLEKS